MTSACGSWTKASDFPLQSLKALKNTPTLGKFFSIAEVKSCVFCGGPTKNFVVAGIFRRTLCINLADVATMCTFKMTNITGKVVRPNCNRKFAITLVLRRYTLISCQTKGPLRDLN